MNVRDLVYVLLFIALPCFAHQDPPESFELNEITFVGSMKVASGEWVAYIRAADGEVLKARVGVWISPGTSQIVKIAENRIYIKVITSGESEEPQHKIVIMELNSKHGSESGTQSNQP